MPHPLIEKSRASFHRLFPEDTRTKMYFGSPQSVKRLWDLLGPSAVDENNFSKISENDILFSIRFFWFHEPSAEMVERWYTHGTRFDFELNGIAHELQNNSEALQYEEELKNSPVPADADYIDYAFRLFLRREVTEQERTAWLDKLRESEWSLGSFVSSFENSDEYQRRLKMEAEPHLVELDRFKIYVRLGDYRTSAPIAHRRAYESLVGYLIDRIVRPGDYVIDVGANVGYHALHMAAIVGEQGKVFAFEPHPGNCELIDLGVAANQFTNFELFPNAAGDAAGEIELLAEGNHTNARINTNPDFDSPTAQRFPVKVVKIDECLRGIPRLRFVKIDAEGAEPMVVAGMSELITLHRPLLLFEFFPDFIRITSQSDPEQFLDQIFAHGYKLFVTGETPLLTEISDSAQVMRLHEESGNTHVDILAIPEELEDSPFG